LQKKGSDMQNCVQISIPNKSDMAFLKKLAKSMKWDFTIISSGIEKGLQDIEEGRIYKAENADDLVKQILG
jgi:predicted transcriptional regulator